MNNCIKSSVQGESGKRLLFSHGAQASPQRRLTSSCLKQICTQQVIFPPY